MKAGHILLIIISIFIGFTVSASASEPPKKIIEYQAQAVKKAIKPKLQITSGTEPLKWEEGDCCGSVNGVCIARCTKKEGCEKGKAQCSAWIKSR